MVSCFKLSLIVITGTYISTGDLSFTEVCKYAIDIVHLYTEYVYLFVLNTQHMLMAWFNVYHDYPVILLIDDLHFTCIVNKTR